MSVDDRQRWDERHAERATLAPRETVLSLPPAPSTGALALDVASGQGRHAIAMREAGYRVVAMDVSGLALRHARGTAPQDADLLLVQADVEHWTLRPASFDLVVQVDFLERRIFAHLRAALRPGGLLLIDTFLDLGRPNREGPSRPEFLLRPGELVAAFPGLEVLRCSETAGDTARSMLLARRP